MVDRESAYEQLEERVARQQAEKQREEEELAAQKAKEKEELAAKKAKERR